MTKIRFGILAAAFVVTAAMAQSPPESEWPPVMPPRGPIAGPETDRIVKVTDSLYLAIVGAQNLVVSVGDDGLLLSDDQDVPVVPRVLAQLAKISDKPVRYVVNSHWHYDHVGGNAAFAKAGAVTIAQDNTLKGMMTERFNPISGRRQGPFAEAYWPKLTFQSRMTLHINGDDIDLIHTAPGHTDADISIYFHKANVIALNDLFFVDDNYPSLEVESGASVQGLIAAYDVLLPMLDDKTIVIPARGPLSKKADLKEFRGVLATIRDRIDAMVKEGKSEAETVAAHPTGDFDAKWGKDQRRNDNFVKAIYEGFKNPPT